MKIKDMFLVSDLDGTILPHGKGASKKNKDAIKKFRELGGTFTVATGRSPLHAVEYANDLGVKAAFIAGNGSRIFDMKTQATVWAQPIKPEAGYLFKDLISDFPDVGVIFIDVAQQFYIFHENDKIARYIETGYLKNPIILDSAMLPDNCCSGWLEAEQEQIHDVLRWFMLRPENLVSIMHSGVGTIDILPSGTTKGTSLQQLAELYGKTLENTIAIGDYNNDIDMLCKAGIGVAVDNAVPEVKAVARLTVASCEDDGLAELIDHLILTADADE